ncbi:LysR family transcriptional regulator [Pseudonocardia eucalypti]|uniref:LysR family transcriptional regulator n=1 Tax=Pseudonocardia eucalypti TaxID=648755 RepID=A0ABP9QN98_9PSEU|nr:DNA-binding transcriptional LysR family regulator [Pseudonocardia eucalypti]
MRFRRLQYFVAVAEELSFTRAAERLHMAQPPLSQQIALLEKDLGVTLVDRTRRTIRLTSAGAALLPEARRLLAELDDAARMVRRVGAGAVGRLTVGFVPTAINGDLPELLLAFREGYPEVELVLRELAPDPLLRAVRERRVDVGLLYRPFSEPELAEHRLSSERLLLALPEGHPLAAGGEVSLTEVRDEPFVLPEQHDIPGIHAAVAATFTDAGIAPRAAQRGVWLVQTVLGLVAAGVGRAVVPESVEAVRRRGVALRPIRDAHHRVELAAAWRRDHDSEPLANFLAGIGAHM